MRTKDELARLREQAITLRREGKSRREIKQILGPMSNSTLNDLLQGVPPPAWTLRPNAKDDLRALARDLRSDGLKYQEIASRLGVSKASISLWVRDLPRPPRLTYKESKRRAAEGVRDFWKKEMQVRDARRAAECAAAAAYVGNLSDRELLIAGAIAYWCEGAKRKSRRGGERVVFVNSDAHLVSFFLQFLRSVGVPDSDLTFCVQIHENADAAAAEQYWLRVTGAQPGQFTKPTLKRHSPKTNRKNTGEDYHGCLRVAVYRSSALYRKIEGWSSAAMAASPPRQVSNLY
jgi:transposase